MENKDYEHLLKNIGSPLDYSEGFYLVYVEVPVTNTTISTIISNHAKIVTELDFGYLCEAHMQAIPEIVRSLSVENHAVYQIIRLVRLNKSFGNTI